MAYNRPSLPSIASRIKADIEATIDGADATTPGTGYTEFAEVQAGMFHSVYAQLAWLFDQLFARSADEATLVPKAAERGVVRIEPTFAVGFVTAAGTNGTVIEANTVWQTESGLQYRSTASVTVAGGTAAVPVIAMAVGGSGNLVAGVSLRLVNPITGLDSNGVVAPAGITGGSDIEHIERLRERYLEHLQRPPMGGKDYDYERWARAAHVDVTRVWVTPHESGIGSIAVRFVCEDLADPIPTSTHVNAVTDYIQLQRPAGLRSLSVAAPDAEPLNLVFTGLTPNTTAVRDAIEAEVKDLIRREAVPGGTLLLSHIREAISRAVGEEDYVITLSANVSIGATGFPTIGVTTWP